MTNTDAMTSEGDQECSSLEIHANDSILWTQIFQQSFSDPTTAQHYVCMCGKRIIWDTFNQDPVNSESAANENSAQHHKTVSSSLGTVVSNSNQLGLRKRHSLPGKIESSCVKFAEWMPRKHVQQCYRQGAICTPCFKSLEMKLNHVTSATTELMADEVFWLKDRRNEGGCGDPEADFSPHPRQCAITDDKENLHPQSHPNVQSFTFVSPNVRQDIKFRPTPSQPPGNPQRSRPSKITKNTHDTFLKKSFVKKMLRKRSIHKGKQSNLKKPPAHPNQQNQICPKKDDASNRDPGDLRRIQLIEASAVRLDSRKKTCSATNLRAVELVTVENSSDVIVADLVAHPKSLCPAVVAQEVTVVEDDEEDEEEHELDELVEFLCGGAPTFGLDLVIHMSEIFACAMI